MADVVVTLPLSFGLDTWVGEGDPAGEPWSGEEWHWYLGIEPGERVYVCYKRRLIGYAPLVQIDHSATSLDFFRDVIERHPDVFDEGRNTSRSRYGLVRHGGAVAVTIDEEIRGFRGFRYRWWGRSIEKPFPGWRNL